MQAFHPHPATKPHRGTLALSDRCLEIIDEELAEVLDAVVARVLLEEAKATSTWWAWLLRIKPRSEEEIRKQVEGFPQLRLYRSAHRVRLRNDAMILRSVAMSGLNPEASPASEVKGIEEVFARVSAFVAKPDRRDVDLLIQMSTTIPYRV